MIAWSEKSCFFTSSKELTEKTKTILLEKGIDVKKAAFSKVLFDDSLVSVSKDLNQLEDLFKNKKINTDTVNLDLILKITNNLKLNFEIFGGLSDTLSIDSIREEEKYIKKHDSNFIQYHYSDGHHREWLTNSDMFKGFL